MIAYVIMAAFGGLVLGALLGFFVASVLAVAGRADDQMDRIEAIIEATRLAGELEALKGVMECKLS